MKIDSLRVPNSKGNESDPLVERSHGFLSRSNTEYKDRAKQKLAHRKEEDRSSVKGN